MELSSELGALIAANVPLIQMVTYEEERVLRALTDAQMARSMGIYAWDVADGFQKIREGTQPFPLKECTSDTLLPHIADKAPSDHIFVLRDFHTAWKAKPGYITRKLRNMAAQLRSRNQFLLFTTPEQGMPAELKDDVVQLHVPLPNAQDLRALFDDYTRNLDRRKLPDDPEVRDKLVTSALGLTTNQARLAFSRVWARFGIFDDRGIDLVTWAKRDVIRESGALEFWPAETMEEEVGGLDLLKTWLAKRETAFGQAAREREVPFPRGVILIGIPGTGKSLTAKMLSSLWKLPLLRLDIGAIFTSLLGEAESNLRKAVALADTVSPCLLWIDEVEKAFAGSGVGSINAGAPTRVFGTFLTWMQEHRTPVYVIATANDVSGLPPELMGRFDRTFFLDLPNDTERSAVFLIHLKRAGVTYPDRTLPIGDFVEMSRGYVGREIERAIREAQFTAFADHDREIEADDVLSALKEIVPISKSHKEVIEELRRWKTDGRAFSASSEEIVPLRSSGRVYQIP